MIHFFEQLLLSIRGATKQKEKIQNERMKLFEEGIKQLEILRNDNDSEDIIKKLTDAQNRRIQKRLY